jgi:homocysteine S-methyltransferase
VLEELGWTTGAYANGFTEITADFAQASASVDLLTKRTDLGPDEYAKFACRWVDQGARIVGGCCEVGPAHIARLKERLVEAGHTIRSL